MKKLLSIFITTVMLISLCSTVCLAADEVSVMVNGEKIEFDVKPFIENNRTMVPLRGVFESLGATVSWDGESRTVFVKRGVDEISCVIGSNEIYKNYSIFAIDTPALIRENRTFVPLRAVSELLDCEVSWQGDTRTAVINQPDIPIAFSYMENTVTKETRKDGVSIVVNYTYPFISDGKDFMAEDVVKRANEIAESVTFNKFDLDDYAFTFIEEWPVIIEEELYGYPNITIDVKTTLTVSETYQTVSFNTGVEMPWTGVEISTRTYDVDTMQEYVTIGLAVGLDSSVEWEELNSEIYGMFQSSFEYVRYGREELDEFPIKDIEFILSGDKLIVYASAILLTGVGRANYYYTIVK